MRKGKHKRFIAVMGAIMILLLVGVFFTGGSSGGESIGATMRDGVLHEHDRISLFGLTAVNPGMMAAFLVTGVVFLLALAARIFLIPRFTLIPGRLQLVLEQAVGFFEGLAKTNSPHRNRFLGAYVFAAGVYIFTSTLFELVGVQLRTVSGHFVTLPAPLSDINGAIALGCLSYGVILSGGIAGNGLRGIGKTLKEFSLPISMSFRLFGALLSGALVNELVYHYVQLSVVLPVLVAVMFTLLHALIQAYVLTMLTALFYGEVSERPALEKK